MPSLKRWREQYEKKLTTPQKAVSKIRRGQRVFLGTACGEPQSLVDALIERASSFADNEIIHTLSLGLAPYAEEKFGEEFRATAFFIGPNVRDAVNQGRANYTPVYLSEIDRLLRTGRYPVDVALITVSPPDKHGFCSFGVSVDITKTAAENADMVIAEVNSTMPRTLGDSFIHISEIDYIVESDRPILEWKPDSDGSTQEVIDRIGKHVADLVEDGSTIQVGYGAIPDAVLRHLMDKKDLGIHTEMMSDGVVDLVDAGVITGRKKTIHKDKIVLSFCMGTRKLFDFIDDNPMIEFHPSSYTNDPCLIGKHDKMVAINSALEVDLTGQVCADQLGYQFYSGLGGQVDFMRGAARSNGGKPIIALPSTARGGKVSRIVPRISEGAGVTTTRGDVHYVITEYGVAELHGKSIMERALALINIAHPDFREELLHAAKFHHYVFLDQSEVPYKGAPYPEEYETYQEFDDLQVFFRPVKPTDEQMLRDLFYESSEKTIYQRFMSMKTKLPRRELQNLVNIDYGKDMAIVGIIRENEVPRIIAVARYMLDRGTNIAEVAFLVHDDFQGKGIGTFLLDYLIRIARQRGVKAFTAEVLPQNTVMLHLFHKTGLRVETKMEEGSYFVYIDLESKPSR